MKLVYIHILRYNICNICIYVVYLFICFIIYHCGSVNGPLADQSPRLASSPNWKKAQKPRAGDKPLVTGRWRLDAYIGDSPDDFPRATGQLRGYCKASFYGYARFLGGTVAVCLPLRLNYRLLRRYFHWTWSYTELL